MIDILLSLATPPVERTKGPRRMNLFKTIRGKDTDYQLYVEPGDHSARFEVKLGCVQDDGTFYYGHEFNDEDPRSSIILKGFIKWDGCSHFYFGESDDNSGYIHTDSALGLAEDLKTLVLEVREMCMNNIKHASRELFE